MAYLYRAIVSLPEHLCGGDQRFTERIVFFETDALRADPGQHLQQLLARIWLTDCSDWCADGLIYNVASEGELKGHKFRADDSTLFEIGWCGTGETYYCQRSKVDIFTTPRTAERLSKALAALPAPAAWQVA